ncbi:hypothetical protein AB0A05_34440 [Streptomyces sp. NPDC046374]
MDTTGAWTARPVQSSEPVLRLLGPVDAQRGEDAVERVEAKLVRRELDA